MKTKILIIDDYNILRAGIKLLLEKYDNFNVVGEVSNPEELLKKLETQESDIIVMNLMLPAKSVVKISKILNEKYSQIPYIILAVNASEYLILECVINGARGIIWKENSSDDLAHTIESVISGERFLNIPESYLVARTIDHAQKLSGNWPLKVDEISNREQEVLSLIAKGYSFKKIADQLHISPRTVESHKNNILSKLDLNSTAEMIQYAINHNLL